MKPIAMDSLDTVEMMMVIEEAFEVTLPDPSSETFGSPSEIVDWLEVSLSNQRPNKAAQRFLRRLALEQQRPELAQELDGLWRREQIEAIVQEVLR
jgi:hypothetical protein